MAEPTKIAVVTGANKGIGLEICRQLASQGIKVILTSRDENRGLEAFEKLKSDYVIFHQLDVNDPASVASLAEFIKSQFGKLDILVNNAGLLGTTIDRDGMRAASEASGGANVNWTEYLSEPYDIGVECLQTNYYGAKRTTEALIPLLQLSDSPRIVNVSSMMGRLKGVPSEWAKGVLNDDAENLTAEGIDEVLNEFHKDFKEGKGSLEAKGWPKSFSAYILSKAALNAYTRLLAKKYPSFRINCVCPGYVNTELNYNTGVLTTEQGAESPVRLALLPDDGPSGLFFIRNEVSSFI